eukprot:CAMPEP_0196577210 /NCGR_PEP_ID=MMETSP1081-20130531/6323_1 /TAXON_ID=36882 /ORGANISM="Pyramimonas amylifera, Strain CCMP720" /LENGTH=89 /DNA_ID=CAMNT_0041896073 /DNA_START=228 /DNA_END=494 /DNA_ORIENTATION=+
MKETNPLYEEDNFEDENQLTTDSDVFGSRPHYSQSIGGARDRTKLQSELRSAQGRGNTSLDFSGGFSPQDHQTGNVQTISAGGGAQLAL